MMSPWGPRPNTISQEFPHHTPPGGPGPLDTPLAEAAGGKAALNTRVGVNSSMFGAAVLILMPLLASYYTACKQRGRTDTPDPNGGIIAEAEAGAQALRVQMQEWHAKYELASREHAQLKQALNDPDTALLQVFEAEALHDANAAPAATADNLNRRHAEAETRLQALGQEGEGLKREYDMAMQRVAHATEASSASLNST